MMWLRMGLAFWLAVLAARPVFSQSTDGESATGSRPAAGLASRRASGARPQKTVKKTLEQAIKALEAYDCVAVAVDFLSPIRRAKIQDLEAYKAQRQCSPEDKGNLEEGLMAMKLARGGVPEYRGVTAVISLEGVGLSIPRITLVKYLDGL